jgi:hypothetical protein
MNRSESEIAEIQKLAYGVWESRGMEPDQPESDWFEAERLYDLREKQMQVEGAVYQQILAYRMTSQMVKLFICPEVEMRLTKGALLNTDLPIQLDRFHIIWSKSGSALPPKVLLNKPEVELILRVKATRPVMKGDPVMWSDIEASSSKLSPPEIDGVRVAYFLWLSYFMDHYTFFDFTPNGPHGAAPELLEPIFPLSEVAAKSELLQNSSPDILLSNLQALNWPPSPGYYPAVLPQIAASSATADQGEIGTRIRATFEEFYWRKNIGFWREVDLFPGRLGYVEKAITEYLDGDYVACIYVLVPQFEGIIRDYITNSIGRCERQFRDALEQLKTIIGSRKLLLFPRTTLNAIIGYLEAGSFWSNTGVITDASIEVNRHGIVHGVFTGFECQDIALKYLILMDSLGFVLLHDRMASGTL